jgi:hypothetical protein
MVKAATAVQALAEMVHPPMQIPSSGNYQAAPHYPVLVDADLVGLRALRAKHAWQSPAAENWIKITRPDQIRFQRQAYADQPLWFQAAREMEKIEGTQVGKDGVILTQAEFEVVLGDPKTGGGGRSLAGLRLMLRRVTENDIELPAALKADRGSAPGLRGSMALSGTATQLRVGSVIQLWMKDGDKAGDGKWHAVEVVVDDSNRTKVLLDNELLKTGFGLNEPLTFGTRMDQPVLLADIQVLPGAASAKPAVPATDDKPTIPRPTRQKAK